MANLDLPIENGRTVGLAWLDGGIRDVVDVERNAILLGLNDGTATLPHIAAELGMPQRTLQRRLSEDGTSFKQLVEDTRIARARYYLRRSTLNITDIAMELGYAEASVFVRAFKRAMGVTPNRYRSNLDGER